MGERSQEGKESEEAVGTHFLESAEGGGRDRSG
jgi:hypothetical protein